MDVTNADCQVNYVSKMGLHSDPLIVYPHRKDPLGISYNYTNQQTKMNHNSTEKTYLHTQIKKPKEVMVEYRKKIVVTHNILLMCIFNFEC